jgi:hypothetical protein
MQVARPHVTFPPQPSATVPQLAPVGQVVAWVQPQTFGEPGLPRPQVRPATHVPQVIAGQPAIAGWNVPQLSPAGQVVVQLETHLPEESQVWFVPHVPHAIVPPQPSDCVPHVCPPVQAIFGGQPQTFGMEGIWPPQIAGDAQVPQLICRPHPSGTMPQLSPTGQVVKGVQVHTFATQACPTGHIAVPHVTFTPQRLGTVPQLAPTGQVVDGVQPHTLGIPPPPHVLGAVHPGQA